MVNTRPELDSVYGSGGALFTYHYNLKVEKMNIAKITINTIISYQLHNIKTCKL